MRSRAVASRAVPGARDLERRTFMYTLKHWETDLSTKSSSWTSSNPLPVVNKAVYATGKTEPRPGPEAIRGSIGIEHELTPDLADRAHPAQGHRGIELFSDDLQRGRHAGLAHRAEAEVERAADQGAFRTEGE